MCLFTPPDCWRRYSPLSRSRGAPGPMSSTSCCPPPRVHMACKSIACGGNGAVGSMEGVFFSRTQGELTSREWHSNCGPCCVSRTPNPDLPMACRLCQRHPHPHPRALSLSPPSPDSNRGNKHNQNRTLGRELTKKISESARPTWPPAIHNCHQCKPCHTMTIRRPRTLVEVPSPPVGTPDELPFGCCAILMLDCTRPRKTRTS